VKLSSLAILTIILAASVSFAEPAAEHIAPLAVDSQSAAPAEQTEQHSLDELDTDKTAEVEGEVSTEPEAEAEAEAESNETAAGTDSKKTPPLAPVNEQDPFGALIRLVGSMIIVLGLIVAAAFISRRMLNRMRVHSSRQRMVNVSQVVALGAKKQVFVLEAGQHTLIIGSSGDSMRLLAKLPRYESQLPAAAGSGNPGDSTPAVDTDWDSSGQVGDINRSGALRDTFAAILKKLHPSGAKVREAS